METHETIVALGQEEQFWKEMGDSSKMVLSTCGKDGRVTSRTVCCVIINGVFYFQTDVRSTKAEQIAENANVALCVDNIQIEGVCTLRGEPEDYPEFLELLEKNFYSTYERYSMLENEVLYAVTPTRLERWIYDEDGTPFIARFDFEKHEYDIEKYEG